MTYPDYDALYERACERKGGEAAVEAMLPRIASKQRLKKLGSDRYLAEFTRKVFQSGFVWRVVDQKWKNFEEVFWDFDIPRLLMMPEDMLDRKAQDPAIIRNYNKVRTVLDNAAMIAETERREDKSFGQFIADWPSDDVVSLWQYLKREGSRLGGNTGPYALRTLGVDTFLLTADVEAFLRNHEIVDSGIGSRRAQQAAQNYFNDLRHQSGRSLSELSRIVSFGIGQNRGGVATSNNQ
ncbi:DNA-3-methyladenine glycosylase [Luminiphilus syltensis NOR5-1B]|uniref:DNA-3-methyladenine glycosylase n=1 Tax=Luminiphilus syltensis NOR5-1B TaxID=565045 RepID=B8KTF2_9GAMM|nr:DNA-3-methyladenine glycosylase I [Luminiphilus syltensis]EED35262.1 DNA-3-methyladenine glycosylase [Luminiphilus syltensis NOR5-1B]